MFNRYDDINEFITDIDKPNIITFEYWGEKENTQYLVEFEEIEDKFILKSLGAGEDIPADWYEINQGEQTDVSVLAIAGVVAYKVMH